MKKLIALASIIISFLVSCKQEVYYSIATKVQPNGTGSIAVSPSSDQIQEGASVTFTAKPNGEYAFTGWSGSLSGTENPKTVTVSSNLNVVANFTLRSYPLSVSVEGEGSVIEKVISTKAEYTSGTTVELTAQPAEHWLFDHWEGDIQGDKNPAQITVTSAKSVKAVFVKKMYDLTVETQGEGAVSEKVVDTKSSYQEGTLVELVAQPSDHWLFDHWEGDLTGSNNPARITVSSSKKVKAVFVEKMYPLTVEVEGNGAVNEKVISTKSGSYQEGTVVELSANPGDHWLFDHWEGGLEGGENPVQITIMSAQTVKAVFVEKMFPLTVEIQGGGVVKEELVGTKGSYQEGSSVKLTATPNTYWAFDHWEGDITGTENPALITISDAASVKAVFVEHDPGTQFTEVPYISPFELNKKLGFGINLGGYLNAYNDSPHTDVVLTQETFYRLKSIGVNTVRLPICWSGHFGDGPEYLIREERMKALERVVDFAEEAGINLIINISDNTFESMMITEEVMKYGTWIDLTRATHDQDYNNTTKAIITALWHQIARRFRDRGDFLIFEAWNEIGRDHLYNPDPSVLASYSDEFKCFDEWNQVFVDAVRSTGGNNATRWLTLSSPLSMHYTLPFIALPHDYVSNNRFILSIHMYEPGSFQSLQINQWGHTARVYDEETFEKDEFWISAFWERMREEYVDKGIAMYAGEMGGCGFDTEPGQSYQVYFYEYFVKAAMDNGVSSLFFVDCWGDDTSFYGWIDYNTGEYTNSYSERLFGAMTRAAYCTESYYTQQYIYDHAPFGDEFDSSDVFIPDPTFKEYILEHYDCDNDNVISYKEALGVTDIDIETDYVESVEGIERFINLKHLFVNGSSAGKGKLTSLDLSNNTFLEELSFINNAVSNLNIASCTQLKTIMCWSNNLNCLDVTTCPQLIVLSCAQNHLSSINLSLSSNLKVLEINDNDFSSIDVSSLGQLEILECGGNPLLKLDVSSCPNLIDLITKNTPTLAKIVLSEGQTIDRIEKDPHTTIAISEGIAIGDSEFEKYLLDNFDSNQDGRISLAEAAEIRDVNVSTLNIRTVQALRHASSLTTLVVNGEWEKQGKLTRLDMSHNPELKQLSFLENNVSSLDISNCSQLVEILCWGNKLSELDLSKCPDLEVLCCAQNNLKTIDVSQCPKLRVFAPNENDLEELDLSNNPLLEEVEINNNPRLKVVWLKKGQTIKHFIKDYITEIRYKD